MGSAAATGTVLFVQLWYFVVFVRLAACVCGVVQDDDAWRSPHRRQSQMFELKFTEIWFKNGHT
jgi:hypothetical protein